VRIPISWLNDQDFCEYQIKLKRAGEDPESADTRAGRRVHSTLEKLEWDEPQMTVADAVATAIGEGDTITLVEAQVIGVRTIGRIDRVLISPSTVEVIDYKPRSRDGVPYRGQIRQAQGYAIAFRERFPYYLQPVVATIVDRGDPFHGSYRNPDKLNRLWSRELDAADVADVNDALDRIAGIMDGSREAQPTTRAWKCGACRFEIDGACDRSCV